ncbi:Cellular retinaldehyde binding/alpha-tocopherol transport,CRAL/TRIO, N-terminal domain,CRAL-TRIO lipid [Cinara cedri]|uniref:Cellular retinaldehyde binding/alpha-tocopherol transport,CRAL/TRIO, N-terminal domain,CRAL-TRIO lipid n=1 Tax=Cinara cedri TaxID=506608 RepID=A0A5E4MGC6_9HEMI|nr:Cellular retinaldehyde binding/alpha-tocopherol transport,CRAL/TRIO, N-terminal domain,CRAL-TRIO lipid [Cinara cedri]
MYEPETSYDEFLKKEMEKHPELNLNDIELLKKQVEANKELPLINEKFLIIFLHGSYFIVENAYKTIVANYRYRKELPQIFSKFDPSAAEMKKVFETVSLSVVTQPCSSNTERIIYTSLKTPNATNYDFVEVSKYLVMMMEYLIIRNGTFDGVILAMNSKDFSLRHISKTPIRVLKRLLGFIQEALPIRLKQVHILDAGMVATTMFNIAKPFLKGPLIAMLQMYPENSEEVFENLPVDIMPSEIGGKGKSHYEYCEEIYKNMISHREWFLSLD